MNVALSTPATRLAFRCAMENQIEALLRSYPGADKVLFTLLRRELPDACRDALDALQACAAVLNGEGDEDAPYLAAQQMRDEACKLADEVNEE